MKPLFLSVVVLSLLWGVTPARAAGPKPLEGVRRVVFLGDSITYSGQYIEYLETLLLLKDRTFTCEFIDLGLPSETVSGLSEPGHAGGQFPRPDLHERLDRVLEQAKPNLIVACYGMNDGIYYPFSEERFQKFQDGMRFLRAHAEAAGAKVLHLTPPVFDPVPIKANTLPAGLAEYRKPYENYDEVLERYGDWLLAQKEHGWDVVDIHGPMKRHLERERRRDPNYRLASDGVHIDHMGHWIIARAILLHWGFPEADFPADQTAEQVIAAAAHGKELLNLVLQRQRMLKDAWLSATGHKRPGMARGLPLDEAERKAHEADDAILKLLTAAPDKVSAFEPTDRYDVKQIEGWTVLVNKGLLEHEPELAERTLTLLRYQLYQVERRLPPRAVEKMRAIRLWVEENEPHHPCMVYHPDAGWLKGHGMNPDKARCVEIANARHFLSWSLEQPWMVLHELAHGYHDQVLDDGFGNAEVKAAFDRAQDTRRYASVLRADGKEEKAYAATNPMEYFAEATEAFFGTNDFFPFVRSELRRHDPEMFDLLKKLWEN